MLRKRRLPEILFTFLLVLLIALPASGREVAGDLAGEVRWSGEVVLTGPVRVPPDAVLRIAPGTNVRSQAVENRLHVRGGLLIEGTEAEAVVFSTPAGWRGIELMEPAEAVLISHARFLDAETAVSAFAARIRVRDSEFSRVGRAIALMRESDLLVESCSFAEGGIGVDSGMKSRAVVKKSSFRNLSKSAIAAAKGSRGTITGNTFANCRQGIGIQGVYPDVLTENVFKENEVGIFCNQTKNSPRIDTNIFRDNKKALVNFAFSYPEITGNIFRGNVTALHNDQFGSARVQRNLFADNVTAVYNYRKSSPKMLLNIFKENETALFCDYSSYPVVRNNNFVDNLMAVKLGIYQSADFEARTGSKKILMGQARSRQSRNPMLAQAPEDFEDFVDVRENWWGGQTAELESAGAEGNLPFFHDRHDQPSVTYEGFGDDSYVLDRVNYTPWLREAVPNAGPEEDK